MKINYNTEGLIPVITQDVESKKVLMLAYMNAEAYEKTIMTKELYYFSRSRQTLWKKGETSGNTQKLKRLSYDCDQDALLAEVEQSGPACHTGKDTCFDQGILLENDYDQPIIKKLISTIQDRIVQPKKGSYTNYLLSEGRDKILKKIGEEATEIVIASKSEDKEEMIYEISDFLYHLLVLMAFEGISMTDIRRELKRRHSD